MQRTSFAAASIVAACSLTLAACGSDPSESPSASGKADSTVRVSGELVVMGGLIYQGPDGHGNPIAGVIRWVNASSGRTTTVRTDAAGRYDLDLDPGTYRVSGGNGQGWPVGSCAMLSTWQAGQRPTLLQNPVMLAQGTQSINVVCEAA